MSNFIGHMERSIHEDADWYWFYTGEKPDEKDLHEAFYSRGDGVIPLRVLDAIVRVANLRGTPVVLVLKCEKIEADTGESIRKPTQKPIEEFIGESDWLVKWYTTTDNVSDLTALSDVLVLSGIDHMLI